MTPLAYTVVGNRLIWTAAHMPPTTASQEHAATVLAAGRRQADRRRHPRPLADTGKLFTSRTPDASNEIVARRARRRSRATDTMNHLIEERLS